MKTIPLLVLLGTVIASNTAQGHDKLQEFNGLCITPTASSDVTVREPCVKALLANSKDSVFNAADPATALFMLNGDKLVRQVESKKLTNADAMAKYLQMQLDLEVRHLADIATLQDREEEAARRQQEQERDAREERAAQRRDAEELDLSRQRTAERAAEQAQRAAEREDDEAQQQRTAAAQLLLQQRMLAQQSRNQAVQYCMQQAAARSGFLPASSFQGQCSTNQNYYQIIPKPTVHTNCTANSLGYSSQVNCTSQ